MALTINADARIDGRKELIAKLKAKLTVKDSPSDAELILYAYEAWGEDCVTHLIGDFAFAIRDDRSRRLFCARDHFGVKPFFYAHLAGDFIFSNRLNELRADPRISDTLNEVAIGDYLLFGVNQDLSTTTFKDIQRLPPGHSLTFADNSIKIHRYWTPSLPREVHFRDPRQYVERFSELLSTAIEDRLRTDRIAVLMSGGLDSTSVAAIAGTNCHAFTIVYDDLIPDEERHYSTIAANHLSIPITHLSADQYSLFEERIAGDMNQPEPFLLSPLTAQYNDLLRLCANHSHVALTGWDGDAFMNETQTSAFRSKLRQLFPKRTRLPQWIDASFGKRTNLLERLINPKNPLNPVAGRPSATRALNSTVWSSLFEGYHPSSTKLNLEIRHPLIDVRLVEYLLSIPPVPWCVNKHILRQAMKNLLPPAIINRPKTALAGDPALQLTRRASVRWLDSFEVNPQLRDFVNLKLRQPVAGEQTSDGLWANLRIFALNYWLTNSQPIVRRATTNQVSNNRTCITSVAQTA